MKKLNRTRTLLSVALLGAFAIAPFMAPTAQADPPDRAPAYGRRDKDKKDKKNKKNKKDERRYDRDDRDDRDDRYDRDDRDNGDRYDRDRYDRDRDYRDRYDRDQRNNRNNQSFTGTVTDVRSGNSFDLRANGRVYNVYISSSLPRGLSRGDSVRVYGRPYGTNDIRNANVSILTNRRDNDGRDNNGRDNDGRGNNSGSYRSYTGVVTDVRSNREFNIRVGGTTYNVTASSSTPRLSRNDTVRVYGQRYGDNDIRNANVTVTRDDRGSGNNNNNNSYGPYRNFNAVVTEVKNDREFNVRIGGTTYNVTASSGTRGLSRGDEVRIYGRRYGVNDIRNANVRITRNR